jgi:hypothetical protein
MRSMVAAAAAGTDQPAATAAKIKTASHTKFRTRPRIGLARQVLGPSFERFADDRVGVRS